MNSDKINQGLKITNLTHGNNYMGLIKINELKF